MSAAYEQAEQRADSEVGEGEEHGADPGGRAPGSPLTAFPRCAPKVATGVMAPFTYPTRTLDLGESETSSRRWACCAAIQIRAPARAITATARLAAALEALRFGQGREGLERVVLDLADPLAGDTEGAADLLERPRLTAIEAEAQLDDASLALGQRGQRVLDLRALQRDRGLLERRLGQLIFDEVTELPVAGRAGARCARPCSTSRPCARACGSSVPCRRPRAPPPAGSTRSRRSKT